MVPATFMSCTGKKLDVERKNFRKQKKETGGPRRAGVGHPNSGDSLLLVTIENLVDHTVVFRFFSRHPVVAVRVGPHLVDGLAGVLGDDGVQLFLELLNLTGGDLDVRGLTLGAAHGLVNHHA